MGGDDSLLNRIRPRSLDRRQHWTHASGRFRFARHRTSYVAALRQDAAAILNVRRATRIAKESKARPLWKLWVEN